MYDREATTAHEARPTDAAASGVFSSLNPTHIRRLQVQNGGEPCFGTERRRRCEDTGCAWRSRCMGLRAAWMR